MSDIPEWAVKRANLETAAEYTRHTSITQSEGHLLAFARYIASKEEAPVDPLLIEAREICALQWDARKGAIETEVANDFRNGFHDDESEVFHVLLGLKRGMELAKEQSNG